MESLWSKLTAFFNNLDSKITSDKYLDICEQLGEEPDYSKLPVDWSDLPYQVQEAINLYSKLGDKIVPDIGFLGKDYSNIETLFNIYEIENRSLVMDILLWMDARNIKKSQDSLKQQRDKIKNKKGGGGLPPKAEAHLKRLQSKDTE